MRVRLAYALGLLSGLAVAAGAFYAAVHHTPDVLRREHRREALSRLLGRRS